MHIRNQSLLGFAVIDGILNGPFTLDYDLYLFSVNFFWLAFSDLGRDLSDCFWLKQFAPPILAMWKIALNIFIVPEYKQIALWASHLSLLAVWAFSYHLVVYLVVLVFFGKLRLEMETDASSCAKLTSLSLN